MACPNKQQLLDAIHGIASGDIVASHIRECAACRKTYGELVTATEVLARVPYDEVSGHCLSEEQLTRYATHRIHPDMEREVEEHLSSCPGCLGDLVSLAEALEAVPQEPPDALRAKVLGLVARNSAGSGTRRAITGRSTRVSARFRRERSSIGAWALAAAAVIAVILIILALPRSEEPAPDTANNPKKVEPKKDEPAVKRNEPKKEEVVKKEEPKPKKEDPKKDDTVVQKEEPKKDEPRKEEPKKEEPVVKQDEPKKEGPKKEEPKKDDTVAKQEEEKFIKTVLGDVRGRLFVQRGSSLERVNAYSEIARGDVLQTGHRYKAAFSVGGGYTVTLRESTQLTVETKEGGDVRIALKDGEAFFDVAPRTHAFVVSTEAADATIKGTSFGMIVRGKETTLMVAEGAVKFKNARGEVEVGANKFSIARAGMAPSRPETRTDMAAVVAWTKRGDVAAAPAKDPFIENIPCANKKLPGLVIVSPYCEHEMTSGDIARATSDLLDTGLLLGHFHRDKGKKIWLNIDRGTEEKVADNGSLGAAEGSKRAMDIYLEYLRQVRAAAGIQNPKAPVPFIVTFRDHSEKVPGTSDELAVCEVAWTGFQPKTIADLKALYDRLLDKYKVQRRIPMKFDQVDAKYDFNGKKIDFKFTESDAKTQGYMERTNSLKAMTFFFPPAFTRSDVELYSKVMQEMIEFLYPR